jgi:hypothetical protein
MNWTELAQGPPMQWVQPNKLKMNYQLVRGNEVITTMRFKSVFGSLAIVENSDGCWTFKRMGFLQTRAAIRPCGSETEIATFRNNTWKGGGALEFPNGRHIQATTNLWHTHVDFQETNGERLIRLKHDSLWCTSATVGVQTTALSAPETSWMVALGWYLMVMMQNGFNS